jgi:hypothetical protein
LRRVRALRVLCVSAIACLLLSSCSSLGPQRLPADRLDYADAVSSSWQRQMLLNIVKLRYGEMPMFLDVASVINQYAIEGTAGVDLFPGGDRYVAGGAFSDRPTVTYTPLTGEAFTKSLLTPLSPVAVFSLIQSGWPVERTLQICVRSINGINNQSAGLVKSVADPEFIELLETLTRLQQGGGLALRLVSIEDPGRVERERGIYISIDDPPPELAADAERARSILGLEASSGEFSITYGAKAMSASDVAMQSRSIIDIMLEMAYSVDVPDEDIVEGRAGTSIYDTPEGSRVPRPLEIHSGDVVPEGTRIAVKYRDLWFWIDDTDLRSKLSLAVLLTLFSLSEGSGPGNTPLMTIN